MSHMRTSIWAGLIKTALYNLNRQQTRVRIFESGLVFNDVAGQLQQVPMLGGLIYGTVESEGWAVSARQVDFYDLKADVETLLGLTGETAEFLPVSDPALHPGQSAEIRLHGERVGVLGALHPSLQSRFGFARTVWLFALDQDLALVRRLPRFREISRFPEVRRDLAIIVDENTSSASILKSVRSTAGEWLTQTVLFDVFQGANLGLGRKSVAFGLILQHPSRTLKDEEVNSVVNQVVASLQHEFNATLRE
jgi:phenylalanyl-tRNA synthetase beta chain